MNELICLTLLYIALSALLGVAQARYMIHTNKEELARQEQKLAESWQKLKEAVKQQIIDWVKPIIMFLNKLTK